MATASARLTIDELTERGTEWYESKIRKLVEADHLNRFLAIDVETGAFAVGDQCHEAAAAVRKDHPNAKIWFIRIGHVAAASYSGGDTREKSYDRRNCDTKP